jgi:hypothetical protein
MKFFKLISFPFVLIVIYPLMYWALQTNGEGTTFIGCYLIIRNRWLGDK